MDGDAAVSSDADAAAVSPPVENRIGPGLLSGRMALLGNDQGEIVQASSDETYCIPAVGDTATSHPTVEVSTPNGGAPGFDRKARSWAQYASMGQSELQQSCRQIYGEVCTPRGMP
jgi:hypothetical protein